MKRKLAALLLIAFIISSLSACGEGGEDYSDYKEQMNNFCESITTLDEEINSLNPEDDDAVEDLFIYLNELEEQFKYFSEIEVPKNFQVTESLADEAYDYMKQANEYFEQSFSDNSFNEYTLEAAMECYARANKRVHYVIDIIHGELPEDENVTFE